MKRIDDQHEVSPKAPERRKDDGSTGGRAWEASRANFPLGPAKFMGKEDQDRWIGEVSHELRTPLAALRLMSEMLMKSSFDEQEKLRALLQQSHEVIVDMCQTINARIDDAGDRSNR